MDNTREKLIELVDKGRRYAADKCSSFMDCSECSHYGEYDGNCGNAYIAESLISNGVTVQKWIPVTERLPENKKCVLLHSTDGGVAEGVYDESEKRWIQWRWSVLNVPQVTHWMPLPQPPKGE